MERTVFEKKLHGRDRDLNRPSFYRMELWQGKKSTISIILHSSVVDAYRQAQGQVGEGDKRSQTKFQLCRNFETKNSLHSMEDWVYKSLDEVKEDFLLVFVWLPSVLNWCYLNDISGETVFEFLLCREVRSVSMFQGYLSHSIIYEVVWFIALHVFATVRPKSYFLWIFWKNGRR